MEASRVSEASGSVEGRGRLVVASLAGPAFGSKRHLQRAQFACQSGSQVNQVQVGPRLARGIEKQSFFNRARFNRAGPAELCRSFAHRGQPDTGVRG